MHNTKIQWADGTVSPVPTCDGCPLRLPEAAVEKEISKKLHSVGYGAEMVSQALERYRANPVNSRRQRILAAVSSLPAPSPK